MEAIKDLVTRIWEKRMQEDANNIQVMDMGISGGTPFQFRLKDGKVTFRIGERGKDIWDVKWTDILIDAELV